MRASAATVAGVLVLGALPATAGTGPGPRNGHGLAWDAAAGRTVLFGGADERAVRGDTWAWNGHEWGEVAPGGPPPRTFPAMAYSPDERGVVLFGGNEVLFGSDERPASFLADTWVLDGSTWTRLVPAKSPSPRAEAAMAWDARRGELVLFGGYRVTEDGTERLGDTWVWEKGSWTRVAEDGPAPRNGAAMAFSPQLGEVVLFGGSGAVDETWAWNGIAWRRLEAPSEGRFNTALTATPQGVLRFGGWNGSERTSGTWRFDGAAWQRLALSGPSARNHTRLVWDAVRERAVLVGGHDGERVFGDVWEFDGKAWHEALAAEPVARIDNGH